uniref:C2H2-type domain-containing protein n=1 Tax=Populus davidiana TaxID=266767 RepID=A0A6M2FAT2_9ROSI
MTPLCKAIDTTTASLLKPSILLHKTPLNFCHSLNYTPNLSSNNLTLTSKRPQNHLRPITATANASHPAATSEIDMVKNRQGIYTSKQNKVVVLWDLDNKPPRGPPYPAAVALKTVAQRFGEVIDMCAYANRHAFIHLPHWVLEERRERKHLDILERKEIVSPSQPYVCGVCGRKCKTNLDLKKHFKQLHERERQKKVNRMRSLKGKKRQRYKERFVSGNHKYNEEARRLLTPKIGYGLAAELRRAGVYVKTVEDKPQAADWALKRQIEHSMSRGVDWLVLVSDDSDFSEILRKAREANLGTVVVGDRDRALGRHADLWVPWIGVENGELTEKDLVPKGRWRSEDLENDEGLFSVTDFDEDGDYGGNDLEGFVDGLVMARSGFNGTRISAFSEGEEEDEQDYLLYDSEYEEIELEDGGFW